MWGVLIFWKDLVSQVFFVCGNIGKKGTSDRFLPCFEAGETKNSSSKSLQNLY